MVQLLGKERFFFLREDILCCVLFYSSFIQRWDSLRTDGWVLVFEEFPN